MIGTALLAALLLADTGEEAAKALRIAWASQYEWREDKIESVTLDFTYAASWKGKREGEESKWSGSGQILVVGNEIVRGHYPGADETRRKQLHAHLTWVAQRFARQPFEEEFKEINFGPSESLSDGSRKIKAGDRAYLVKADRLVGMEVDVGSVALPFITRVDWTTNDLGGGYAVFSELQAYSRAGAKWSSTRTMEVRKEKDVDFPAPLSLVVATQTPATGAVEIRFSFSKPVANAPDPIVGDVAARAELEGAWGRRFVVPADARIDGEFQRKVDRDLAKLGWTGTVKGEFAVVGLESCELILDDKLFRNPQWASRVADSCRGHFTWFFGFLQDREFETEFAKCGFRRAGDAIEVLGYAKALAFRVQEGRITGYQANDAGSEVGTWWEFRLKENKEDLSRIEAMTASLGGKSVTLRHKYQRVRGVEIPTSFEALGVPEGGGIEAGFGVAEYELKKLKVTRP